MKNCLASVLGQLQDGLAAQPKTAKSWRAGALLVATSDRAGATTVSVRQSALAAFATPEQYDALAAAGLLKNGGIRRKVRIGTTSTPVLDIDFDGLLREVRRTEAASSRVVALEQENTRLKRRLRVAQDEHLGDAALAELLHSLRRASGPGKPQAVRPLPFTRAKPSRGQALAGIPTLMLSDLHWGEAVDPAQISHLNGYSLDIARTRLDRVFNTSLELLFHHQAGQSYDGLCLALAGDMVSGNVFEELRRSNAAPVLECVQDLTARLAERICMVASQFAWVYVPCVAGNHGRIDSKPTFKNAVKDNFDTHTYRMVKAQVEGRLGDRCNVDFDISEALDMRFNLYGTRYLLTHGDQLSVGTSGGVGFWPGVMRGALEKQQREAAARGEGFDYLACGHFHRYGAVSNIVMNGSLKGYDEWAYRMNFEYEVPVQALWTTHPDYGIIDRRPVYAEHPAVDSPVLRQPVTTFRNGWRRAA